MKKTAEHIHKMTMIIGLFISIAVLGREMDIRPIKKKNTNIAAAFIQNKQKAKWK